MNNLKTRPMEKITYQEIDIKLNVIFLQRQIRPSTSVLDAEIKEALNVDFDSHSPEPMEATEVESAMDNAHIRITTSVNWTKNEPEISQYIINKVIKMLPMGVAKVELMSLREENEIYSMTLKERLTKHYGENRADFDPEETDNVLEILKGCKYDLRGATKWDLILLERMINNDSELTDAIQELIDDLKEKEDDDPFA